MKYKFSWETKPIGSGIDLAFFSNTEILQTDEEDIEAAKQIAIDKVWSRGFKNLPSDHIAKNLPKDHIMITEINPLNL